MERVSKADLSLLAGRDSSRADLGLLLQPRSKGQQAKKSPSRDPAIVSKGSNLPQKIKDAEVARPFLEVVENQLATAKNINRSKSTLKSPIIGRSSASPRRRNASRPQALSQAFTLLSKSSEGVKTRTIPLVFQPPTDNLANLASDNTQTGQNGSLSSGMNVDVARFRNVLPCRRCIILKIRVTCSGH